ncbi:MAG: glutamate-5-semialdehyde dehydrogenase [Candidatus Altiarchaeota archaeon]|nr:glutamate-5-semialdehyde dehydrogenase [Candidatus Altiarchaeota archaeon]
MTAVIKKAEEARKAFFAMAKKNAKDRDSALSAIAGGLVKNRSVILKANALDVKAAEGRLSSALIARLKLESEKIDGMARYALTVASLEDPVGKTLEATELDRGLLLYKVSAPIGVIGCIFESRPDVVPQIASLCLKSGNSVIMKGGSEAVNTNRALYKVIRDASEGAGMPAGWIQLAESRKDVEEMLRLDGLIDLLIPRGGKNLVEYIKDNTKIPVMGHSEGICHAYVDRDADLKMAVKVCLDAKVQYPAVCNAIETLLVDEKIAKEFLPMMADAYAQSGVEMRVDAKAYRILSGFVVKKATEKDWRTEYNDLIISIKVVAGVKEAIEHVNAYGSHHTDTIITGNKKTARRFMQEVDSASVMHNCSTRFADGYRYGLGAEVGISTGKYHARGPVGLQGLTTYKYLLEGSGQVVKDYVGPRARKYIHRKIQDHW